MHMALEQKQIDCELAKLDQVLETPAKLTVWGLFAVNRNFQLTINSQLVQLLVYCLELID